MSDLISTQEAIDALNADKIKRCRFEYINACKIVAHPTPDTSKNDIYDAYAVMKALYPIFGDEECEEPSAQPEIIHCKECMNHGKEICYFWSRFYGTINTPNDGFCHKAERRTDD